MRMAVRAERMRRCIGGWVGSRPCEECLMVEHPKVQMEAYRDGAMRLTGQADWVALH